MSSNPHQEPGDDGSARIGRWRIPWIPSGWQFIPEYGIRQAGASGPASNVAVGEDELLVGDRLAAYVDAQIAIMKQSFQTLVIAGPRPAEFAGADEALLLMLKHQTVEGIGLVQVQNYVRREKWIGIVTLTALEQDLLKVRKDYENFAQALSITAPAR